MSIREALLTWIDQFENDHYVFDIYGETVTVDLPRETVEQVMDIAILLVDRVVEAQGDLATAEYEELEAAVRKEYPDDSEWVFHVGMEAFCNDRLVGKYRDIEPMVAKLMPRGYPPGSAAYLFTVHFELEELIYAVIRHVDDVKENYDSLVFTFFAGVLTKGWGEGLGWSKTEEGNWQWTRREEHTDENDIGAGGEGTSETE